jgi:hypothetical protein
MPILSTRAAPLLLLVAIVLSACGDQADPTKPIPEDPNRIITCGPGWGGGGGGGGTAAAAATPAPGGHEHHDGAHGGPLGLERL